MIGMLGTKNRIVALAAAVSFAFVSPVVAQDEFTSYSTTKGGCTPEQSLENLIESGMDEAQARRILGIDS